MGNQRRSKSKHPEDPEFWVTNVSKRNVSLSDLGITIPAKRSFNLLNPRNFSFTEELLIKSASEGSLWRKRHLIKMGIQNRQTHNDNAPTVSTQPIQVRKVSAVVLEEPEYSDWLYTDEEFAREMSEDPE